MLKELHKPTGSHTEKSTAAFEQKNTFLHARYFLKSLDKYMRHVLAIALKNFDEDMSKVESQSTYNLLTRHRYLVRTSSLESRQPTSSVDFLHEHLTFLQSCKTILLKQITLLQSEKYPQAEEYLQIRRNFKSLLDGLHEISFLMWKDSVTIKIQESDMTSTTFTLRGCLEFDLCDQAGEKRTIKNPLSSSLAEFLERHTENKILQECRPSLSFQKSIDPAAVIKGRHIDKGCQGEVFHGTWHQYDVAIKSYNISGSRDKEHFQAEINVLKMLDHKNIIQYIGQIPGNYEVIMSYANNGNYEMYLNNTALAQTVHQRLFDATQMAAAITYLHQQDVIHCDIKPSNFLKSNNTVLLADFGLAIFSDVAQKNRQCRGSGLYLASEVTHGHISKFSDMFSFGQTLYQMLTNKLPHADFQPSEQAQRIHEGDVDPAPEYLGENYGRFFRDLRQKSPTHRPSAENAKAFLLAQTEQEVDENKLKQFCSLN